MRNMGMTFFYENQTYYYTHRRIEHFVESDAALNFLQKRKEVYYKQMRQRFQQNYLASIDPESLKMLEESMSNENEIINTIDSAMKEYLNRDVAQVLNSLNFNENDIAAAYENIDKYVNTRDMEALDAFFEGVEKGAQLLEDDEARTALLAMLGQRKNFPTLKKFSNYLRKQIAAYEGKMVSTKQSTMLSVARSLRNLTFKLGNKNVSKNSLKGSVKNIFSAQFGEYVTSKAAAVAEAKFYNTIEDSLVGSKNVKLETDFQKKFWQNYGSKSKKYKTDNKFKNFNIEIEETSDSIKIDLGISSKWYKGLEDTKNNAVQFTSETSFAHRLSQMLDNDVQKYYVYNALTLAEQDASIYRALKAAIVARNLDTMISGIGYGTGDFSQFLVINGHFYSIWEIIQSIERNNSGSGSSDMDTATDPVTISASGLKKILDRTKEVQGDKPDVVEAYIRAREQNQMIEKDLRLTGHFYPQRFRNLLR